MKKLMMGAAVAAGLFATVAVAQDARTAMRDEIILVLQAQQIDARTASVVAQCVMLQMSDDQVARFTGSASDAAKTAILDELGDPAALNACVSDNI